MNIVEIPNAIPLPLLRAAEAVWPRHDWPYWHRYNSATSNKFGSMDRLRIPPACIAALDAAAIAASDYIGESFIDYDLHGAGLHLSLPGGYVAKHLDAERHPIREWRRTHSIIVFASSGWREEYGGQLCIDGHRPIVPTFGLAVVFETQQAIHEVLPVSNECPINRKTLSLFAWTGCDNKHGCTSANFL